MIGLKTDSKIANLPLMKIARHYGSENCEWYWGFNHHKYDKIYYSKIFDFTADDGFINDMEVGGTGHDLKKKLPPEIDSLQPDYSIYPEVDYSLQYFSRGCIRKCKFCVVPEKEGGIKAVQAMDLNPAGKYIRVLDNNFFANPQWRQAIDILKKIGQPILFDSGLDVRIFNADQGNALQSIKIYKTVHIAWDDAGVDLTSKIKLLTEYIKPYKITCYVLIGFDSTSDQDYYRVMKIHEMGVNPFVMPYNKKDIYQKRFARWVNHKAIFKTIEWKNYRRGK